MARKKDLGGLAALAGLAYMASREKAAKGESTAPAVNATTGSASDTRDYGVDYSESPNRGGDFMSDKEPGWDSATAPARKPAAPTARRAPTAGGRENARDDVLMRQGRYPGTTAEGMRNYAPRRSAAQQIAGRDDTYNPDVGYRTRAENRDTSDLTYKKGGSVKGWGSARGARKAKIY
jgi:hypothetical protein